MNNAREAPVVAEILSTLLFHRWVAFRINAGMIRIADRVIRLAPKGTSDVLAVVPGSGRIMVVEAKRPKGGRLSPAQDEFLAAVEGHGGVALLVSDVRTLDRAIAALKDDPYAKLDRNGARL